MKKKSYLIMLFVLMVALTTKVSASTCKDERVLELSSLANDVKVSYQEYETKEPTGDISEGTDEENFELVTHAYYLTIYNLPKDLSAVVKREDTEKVVSVTADNKDEDGVIYIDAGPAGKVKTFTIGIKSNDSNCMNEMIKTTSITLPMYNFYSTYEICKENPEIDVCKNYTTTDYTAMTLDEFYKKVDEQKNQKIEEEKKNSSIFNKIGQFLNEHKVVIIIVILIILIIIIFIIYMNKKRKKSELNGK